MTGATPHLTQGRAGRLRAGVWALALLAAVSPLATGMCLPALPSMRADLSASEVALQLTTTTFLGGLAVGQLVLGAVSDRAGRRRPLLIGAVSFVVASIACALAPTVQLLIAARFLQGAAGAAGIVLGRAIIADVLEGAAAARAFALLMTIGAIGPVVAPLLGGALLEVAGWRAVFAGLTAVGLAMLLVVVLALPETLPVDRRAPGRLRAGAAIRPLLQRSYIGNTLVLVFAYAGLIGYVSASPFVLQTQYGLSPVAYATVFAVNALGLALGSFVVARLVHRVAPGRLLHVGLVLQSSVACALLALALSGAVPLPALLVLLWLFVTSLSLIAGNATSLALAGLTDRVGAGSALLGALQFGAAAAVAPIVGVGGGNALVPMTAVLVAASLLAAVVRLGLTVGTPRRDPRRAPARTGVG